MAGSVHVHPVADAIEHDTVTPAADCVCGPLVFPYRDDDDGPVLELVVHSPLDCGESEWIAVDAP
jgi:hypothetical protein